MHRPGERATPTVSTFYGIAIRMYVNDHDPPHFHAMYAEHECVFVISDLSVLRGGLPNRALGLVREWAGLHKGELIENWQRCRAMSPTTVIPPLP
jgi:hypothetical protein